MLKPVRSMQEFAAGALMCAIALAGLWFGREWSQGTLAFVEAGFFPRLVSVVLLVLGGLILAKAFLSHGPVLSAWAWRPLIAVTLAVLVFALVLEPLGLVLAILAIIALANFAGQPLRPVAFAVLWAALAAGCVAIFSWGLALPLKVWP